MPTILVVDDSESDRRLLEIQLLENPKYQVRMASSGPDALAQIQLGTPDLVLIDLQMPAMDGLELVTAVRNRFPQVPVVLVTGHGSEIVAIEALQRGATSYVPKSHLADRLGPTIEEVLALTRGERSDVRLIGCLDKAEFAFTLDNDPDLIPPLVDLLQQMIGGIWDCELTEKLRIAVALEETLTNAMLRGNLEIGLYDVRNAEMGQTASQLSRLVEQRRSQPPFHERRIALEAFISTSEVRFVIRDGGRGFDQAAIPKPTDPGNLDRLTGRGLTLMRALMDDVTFNKSGNEVTLVKRTQVRQNKPGIRESPSLFSVRLSGNILIITPQRNVSSLTEQRVQDEVNMVLDRFRDPLLKNVLIDFGKISYFGAAMLEMMRLIANRIQDRKGRMAVCGVSHVGAEILQITKFDIAWPNYVSRANALDRMLK